MRIKHKSVYVIYNPSLNITKVGISNNVIERKNSIVSASGCHVSILYKSPTIYNSAMIERDIHNKFSMFKTVGEWFSVNPSLILNYIKTIESNYQIVSK